MSNERASTSATAPKSPRTDELDKALTKGARQHDPYGLTMLRHAQQLERELAAANDATMRKAEECALLKHSISAVSHVEKRVEPPADAKVGYWIDFKRGWWARSHPPHDKHIESSQTTGHYAGNVTEDQAKELGKIVDDYLTTREQPPRLTAYGMRDFIARAIAYWQGQDGRGPQEAAELRAMIERSVAPTEEPIGYALEAAHWRLMKHCYGEVEDVQVGYAIKAIEERIGVNGIENVPASPFRKGNESRDD